MGDLEIKLLFHSSLTVFSLWCFLVSIRDKARWSYALCHGSLLSVQLALLLSRITDLIVSVHHG